MRSVFVMTAAATLGAASAVAAQTTSAPPAAAPAASAPAPSAPATCALALAPAPGTGHADALTINQQHSLAKQRRPLPSHSCPTQSGAER